MSSDSFQDYLNEIGREVLLRPDEEIELSRLVKRYLELRDTEGELTPKEKREMKRGLKARERLIRCNLRLVVMVAKKYRNRLKGGGLEMMDLVQEGTVGLARAAELYDGTKGYKFSTYAYWWIRQGITRAIAQTDKLIRIPQHQTDMMHKALQVQREFLQEKGRSPTMAEWCEALDTNEETLLLVMQRSTPHVSLNGLATEDGSPLIDLIADDRTPSDSWEDIGQIEQYEQLKLAFFRLTEAERDVVSKRFGFDGYDVTTFTDIGKQAGTTRETARQNFIKGANKIKLFIKEQSSPFSLAA
jgi:RNA polymerase sigma factor (sigma-70 family)